MAVKVLVWSEKNKKSLMPRLYLKKVCGKYRGNIKVIDFFLGIFLVPNAITLIKNCGKLIKSVSQVEFCQLVDYRNELVCGSLLADFVLFQANFLWTSLSKKFSNEFC